MTQRVKNHQVKSVESRVARARPKVNLSGMVGGACSRPRQWSLSQARQSEIGTATSGANQHVRVGRVSCLRCPACPPHKATVSCARQAKEADAGKGPGEDAQVQSLMPSLGWEILIHLCSQGSEEDSAEDIPKQDPAEAGTYA